MDILNRAGAAVSGAASAACDSAAYASDLVSGALPSGGELKRQVGQALIAGGKLLIDPRAAVGELTVALGTSLVAEASPEWLLLEASPHGFALLLRGDEATSHQAYLDAVSAGKTVIWCQVMAAQLGSAMMDGR